MSSGGRTVKELLKLITHYASVAVDLALYSITAEDKTVAVEALKIESKVDEYVRELISRVALAVRNPDEAGLAVGVAEVGRALDKVTDAAGDLAGLVLRGYPIHEYVKNAVNCCGDIVILIKSGRKLRELPSIVDLLLIKRGETYLLAPETESLEKGDLVIARGTREEIADLARELGDHRAIKSLERTPESEALADEELAGRLVKIKFLARQSLDLAFHSLIYGDPSLANLVREMEDTVDSLYHEILEYSYVAANPSNAREMISVAIFDSSMESIADAAAQMASIVKRLDEYSIFISEALEEAEEIYLRLRATEKVAGKTIGELGLADKGISVIALGRKGAWILPVRPDHVLEDDDILLVKYFKPVDAGDEEELMRELEELGFEIVED